MAPKKSKAKVMKDANLLSEAPVRGKTARADFLTDIATASTLPLQDVKKCLDALRVTISRNLRENKKCRIPNMLSLRLRIYPAREESTKIVFGKEKTVKARPTELKKITASALKPLKDSVK